jgi:hypothetical protein
LIPEFPVQSPLQKLSHFDEPTSLAVSMTESRTQRDTQGKKQERQGQADGKRGA